MRLSIGAVNVESGNFAYFDNQRDRITAEHVMASGALPPGMPPVEIEGQYYWDGGLVSNTPLEYVLDTERTRALLVFQVDLFPARGPMPANLVEVAEREMDIRYSSRTRLNTDQALRVRHARGLVRQLLDKLPPQLAKSHLAKELAEIVMENPLTVVHLIYRTRPHEGSAKDYEFSRATMLEHWASGAEAVRRSMCERAEMLRPPKHGEAQVFDVSDDEGPRSKSPPA
jgi:NTE family protein